MSGISKEKVIVIGAGIAGISAAVKLIESGHKVTLIESSNHIGGRMYSFKDKTTGDTIDNGQHLMMGAYRNFLELVEILETKQFLEFSNHLEVDFVDYKAKQFKLKPLISKGQFGLVLGLIFNQGINFVSKMSIIKLLLRIKYNYLFENDLSVKELLLSQGQSQESITKFWEPITLATLNASIDNASSELFLTVVRKAFFSDAESMKMIIPNKSLKELIDSFPLWFKYRGGSLMTSNVVSEILFGQESVFGVKLNDGMIVHGDAVVSALPPKALSKILPAKISQRLQLGLFESSPIISVYLWTEEDFVDVRFASMLDTETQWIFNRTILSGNVYSTQGHYAITISNAGNLIDRTKSEIVDLVWKDINQCFPNTRLTKIKHSVVIKERNATVLLNNKNRRLRPKHKTSIINFYLAGDWTETGLPATIEGACLSGFQCAELINAKNHLI